jgi:predicted phage-related endonuclease
MSATMTGRGYLGGGSIAAVLGLSPYQTPLDAYCEITGEMAAPISDARRAFFDRRKAWEPMAREVFQAKTDATIVRFNERYTLPSLPWARAEIDAETADGHNVEFKSLRPELRWLWEPPGDDGMGVEPPLYVMAQAAWGLGIHPAHPAGVWVHALDLDDDLIYYMERDQALIQDIFERAERFWRNHVEPRRPPLPVDVGDLLRLYGKGTPRAVEATPEIAAALQARAAAVQTLKIHTAEQLRAELVIKQFMRDASVLTLHGRPVASWKADVRGIRSFRQTP